MTSLVCLLLGVLAPLVFVGPLVGAITQRVVFKRPPAATVEGPGLAGVARAFKPLDLGPDLVRWPSEVPRTVLHFPEPPWPSELWNDEHFGRKRRPSGNAVAALSGLPAGVPLIGAGPSPTRPASGDRAKPARVVEAVAAEASFFETPVARAKGGLGGLSDAEIRALVEREGLVRAVEILVERAGVDAGTVARELRRILAEVRERRR